jgi:hypothetical protein
MKSNRCLNLLVIVGPVLTEYELKRRERLLQNNERMRQMGVRYCARIFYACVGLQQPAEETRNEDPDFVVNAEDEEDGHTDTEGMEDGHTGKRKVLQISLCLCNVCSFISVLVVVDYLCFSTTRLIYRFIYSISFTILAMNYL